MGSAIGSPLSAMGTLFYFYYYYDYYFKDFLFKKKGIIFFLKIYLVGDTK